MGSERRKIRSETRITSSFEINKQKFRLCYMPRGNLKVAALQLNYYITGIAPYVQRIIGMGKYEVIKLYLNRKYIPSKELLDSFIESIAVAGYCYLSPERKKIVRTSQELKEYVHICTIEKEKSVEGCE
ncbi:hypothetical protein PAEPH01_0473 [Pancytospora epiphaga]|nr:hypothetical protein PAEPH01_0473 [Pancytospora epiphaga]